MLRHIKDIHSPIDIARMKSEARKLVKGSMSPSVQPSTTPIGADRSSLTTATTGGVGTSAKISFAVAIYPYDAEQDDEFSVSVYVLPLSRQNSR